MGLKNEQIRRPILMTENEKSALKGVQSTHLRSSHDLSFECGEMGLTSLDAEETMKH